MTSEEISKKSESTGIYGFPAYAGFVAVAIWLKEIAYQLAVANELKMKHRFDHLDGGDPR